MKALDALGKWSLIDNYVLVLMMVAFRLHIALPTADTLVKFMKSVNNPELSNIINDALDKTKNVSCIINFSLFDS